MATGLANLMIAGSVSAMILTVVYFSRRKFTTFGLAVRYLGLTVVFRDDFLFLESTLNSAFSTAEVDILLMKWNSHMPASSRIPLKSQKGLNVFKKFKGRDWV